MDIYQWGGKFGGKKFDPKKHPPKVAFFGENLAVFGFWDLATLHTNQSKFLTSKNCKAKLVFQVCLELHSHILDIIFRKQITNYRIFSLLNIGCVNISLKVALNQRLTTFQNVKKNPKLPTIFCQIILTFTLFKKSNFCP